jgi:pimeloyl-ACP methyl ester carboxylesterase
MRLTILIPALFLAACSQPPGPKQGSGEPVVLLHGLALKAFTMKKIARGLEEAGYKTCRIDYPSRHYPIDTLVARFVAPRVEKCFPGESRPLNFVTHSMGGILLRKLALLPGAPKIGRAVMIAPPNHGSEVVDHLGDWKVFGLWNGPAGRELGTDSNSVPNRLNRLGAPRFEFGVLAANRSIEPVFSEWITGPDDGKVGVESAKLEGMKDFVEVEASHTFVLAKDETVKQVVAFLKGGRFRRDAGDSL